MFKRLLPALALLLFSTSNHAYAQNGLIEEPLTHFGQDVLLNGANIAWINFGSDVGSDSSTAEDMQVEFQRIASYGGNSARWWLHASGWFSPDINSDGFVRGISPNTQNGVSHQDVINQVRGVLDAAWEEGILLTISLFSYDIACGENNTTNGSVYRGSRFDGMLNLHYESYFDNVLTPLVTDLRDHPALFAWEIFNEADGMSTEGNFFEDNCPLGSYPQSNETLQRFVNLAAARIHAIDPNVKVTTSVSQTAYLDQYTNDVLTGQDFSDPEGTLDFYQAHWYWEYGHPSNPYEINAQARNLDKPIVMGEFGYGTEPATQTPPENLSKAVFDQGYAGSWIWDTVSLSDSEIETVVSGASAYSPPIDKDAIEACIISKEPSCYTRLPGETTPSHIISGTSENDNLQGGSESDTINGFEGDDFIDASTGDDRVFGGDGNDMLIGGSGIDYIEGGQGNDFLRGGDGDDILNGGFGVDYLRGGAGADELNGYAGQDWADYITSSAAVTVNLETNLATGGDAQGDSFLYIENVYGSSHDDNITGDTNVNYLRGWSGDDQLFGGDGNDYLQGGLGADALDGGAGTNDWAYYVSSAAGLTLNLGDTSLNTGEAVGDSYTNIENLVGSRFDDDITGDSSNNFLRGLQGDDVLNGGDGDDFLRGELGADVHNGGAGNDWAYYIGSTSAVTVDLGANTGTGGEAQGDTFISIERVYGTRYDDDIAGDSAANFLRGSFGEDTLTGEDGNDVLQGDAGADTLDGGAGSDWAQYFSSTALLGTTINLGDASQNTGEASGDVYISIENIIGSRFNDIITGDSGANTLRGSFGDDTLNGGAGDDILRGEDGADTFVFEIGGGNDVIIDWIDADDILDLSDFRFNKINAAIKAAAQVDSDVVFTIGNDSITIRDTSIKAIKNNLII